MTRRSRPPLLVNIPPVADVGPVPGLPANAPTIAAIMTMARLQERAYQAVQPLRRWQPTQPLSAFCTNETAKQLLKGIPTDGPLAYDQVVRLFYAVANHVLAPAIEHHYYDHVLCRWKFILQSDQDWCSSVLSLQLSPRYATKAYWVDLAKLTNEMTNVSARTYYGTGGSGIVLFAKYHKRFVRIELLFKPPTRPKTTKKVTTKQAPRRVVDLD